MRGIRSLVKKNIFQVVYFSDKESDSLVLTSYKHFYLL